MSFAQMEGQCYKCGAKGHLSNTHTKNVTRGQNLGQDEDARHAVDASQWGYNEQCQ